MNATLTSAVTVTPESLVKRANGNRRVRTVSPAIAGRMIAEMRDREDGAITWTTGGSVAAKYGYPAVSTVVVAAKIDGCVYFGAGVGGAIAVSPGRAFTALANLGSCKRPETIEAKIRDWAKSRGVVQVD